MRLLILLLLAGCAAPKPSDCPPGWTRFQGQAGVTCLSPKQSWDQGNLKRHDTADCINGNPVFTAPEGVLQQCL